MNSLKVLQKVFIGDGTVISAIVKGNVKLHVYTGGRCRSVMLYDVLHMPELAWNLFSVRACTSRGASVLFNAGQCSVVVKDETVITGSMCGKLYSFCEAENTCAAIEKESANLWHQRFGHICRDRLNVLASKSLVTGMNSSVELPGVPRVWLASNADSHIKRSRTVIQVNY